MHTTSEFARRTLALFGALAITMSLLVGSFAQLPQVEIASRVLA